MDKAIFPFSAIIGQESAKMALIYSIINKRIGGVLLCGQKGCAKSTLVRSFANILHDISIVNLPLNITDDMLLGTIDLESAIKYGRRSFKGGVLARADRNILYVDEVNLLSDSIVNSLLDVSQSGVNRVEREGISYTHKSRFLLVGTMNPEESPLRPEFLDRFGLYVELKGIQNLKQRKEIIKRVVEFEKDPVIFKKYYEEQDERILAKITDARKIIKSSKVSEEAIGFATDIAIAAKAQGHRVDILLIETAIAIAAFDGRGYVSCDDVKKASEFVLPHRMNKDDEIDIEYQNNDSNNNSINNEIKTKEENTSSKNLDNNKYDDSLDKYDYLQTNNDLPNCNDNQKEDLTFGSEIFSIDNLPVIPTDRKKRKGSGRRSKTASRTKKGRYIGFDCAYNDIIDIALDATLRAAAPYQIQRANNDLALSICKNDIRIKRRENHIGTNIIFLVDASGSMGAEKRMKATKEVILSLLFDAYQKRDKVGMIAFRKDFAEVVLPITRSVELAQKKLQYLPTGGRTPLAKGIFKAWQMIKLLRLKDKDMIPLLVLITDGRANDKQSRDPIYESLNAANIIGMDRINSIVIDTEKDIVSLGITREIASRMNAKYVKSDELKKDSLRQMVKSRLEF